MATFNYQLGRKKDNGTYPVYLKVRHGKSNTMRSLDMSVTKSEWNEKGQRISIRRTDTYEVRAEKERNNEFLAQLMIRAKEVEALLQKRGVLGEMTAKGVMDAILNYSPHSKQNEGVGNGDFVEYWNTIAVQTPKSQEKYIYALKSLVSYQIACSGKDTILFRDITVDWVKGYLSYIQGGGYQYVRGSNPLNLQSLSAWTVNTYASCLKKVINCAVDADRLSERVLRAFKKFRAGVVHTQPYTLSMAELRAFLNYPFPTMRQRMVRDLFIFSFCTMGMNLTDIYQLQKKAVKMKGDTGEIKYIRDKTGKEIIVMMNAHASQLHDVIAPYLTTSRANVWSKAVSSSRYFAFDAIYNRYHTFAGNIQKIARQVRTIMGFDDEFCFYTARHTWSTLMSSEYQLGQEYVDAGLGHSSKSVAANHYIAIDYDKLYEAHTDILQRLFEDKISTTDLMEIEE